MSKDADAGPPQIVITLAALAAGAVAQQVVGGLWRFVRGSEPNDDEETLMEALVFAAVSAAAVAAARTLATRRARRGPLLKRS